MHQISILFYCLHYIFMYIYLNYIVYWFVWLPSLYMWQLQEGSVQGFPGKQINSIHICMYTYIYILYGKQINFLASKFIPYIYIYICLVFITYEYIPNNVLFCCPYNWALVLCCVLKFSAAYFIYSNYISKNHVYFSQLPLFFTSK